MTRSHQLMLPHHGHEDQVPEDLPVPLPTQEHEIIDLSPGESFDK